MLLTTSLLDLLLLCSKDFGELHLHFNFSQSMLRFSFSWGERDFLFDLFVDSLVV